MEVRHNARQRIDVEGQLVLFSFRHPEGAAPRPIEVLAGSLHGQVAEVIIHHLMRFAVLLNERCVELS